MLLPKHQSHTLTEIATIIRNLPIVFFSILAIIIFSIAIITVQTKEKNQLKLLKQEQEFTTILNQKENLEQFVYQIDLTINQHFQKLENELKKYTFQAKGYANATQEKSLSKVLAYMQKIEATQPYSFVVFDEQSYDILYGEDIAKYIESLLFSIYPNHTKHTLQYIHSQGQESILYWKDELKKEIRLSFFDRIMYGDTSYFIGIFSTIDNLRNITKQNIAQFIQEDGGQKSPKNTYFSLLDYQNNEHYNAHNKKQWGSFDEPYLSLHNLQIQKLHLSIYEPTISRTLPIYEYYDKYALLLLSHYDKQVLTSKMQEQKNALEKQSYSIILGALLIIIIVFVILLAGSIIFGNSITHIVDRFSQKYKKKSDKAKELKKRYELAIIASNDGIWDIDFEQGVLYFSKKWLSMFGYKRGDIVSFEEWLSLLHPKDQQKVQQNFDEHLRGNSEHFICEYRLKTKQNKYKWVLARGKVFAKDGARRMLMSSMDIDERKKSIRELENIEQLVEQGNIAIIRWKNTPTLEVEYVSNSISEYGYVKSDFEDNKLGFGDIIHPEDLYELQKLIDTSIRKNQKSFSFTYRICTKMQEVKWVFTRALLLENDFSHIEHLYGYIYDITPIKQSEEELAIKVQKEVVKNRQKDSLLVQQNKLASMGEMLGSIAHQWRQPLNNISLVVHFLKDSYLTKQLNKKQITSYFGKIKLQLEYMSNTISDFSNFYKPSKNKNEFSLKNALSSTLNIIDPSLQEEKITITIMGDDAVIYSYENEFKQALLNILSNAKEAIVKKKSLSHQILIGKINITIQQEADIILRIANNGINLKEGIQDRIFEPYFSTKFQSQGTGIGLYMSKSIIEKSMQGSLEVVALEAGVEFVIRLPKDNFHKQNKNATIRSQD